MEPGPTWLARASHSHLFPGARLRPEPGSPPLGAGEGLILFSDDSQADATLDGSVLSVGEHTTLKGTAIGPAAWEVELGGGDQPAVVRRRVLPGVAR
ncbi:MAG: hypothetical protein QM572_14780 [Nocardioides sp.]|uniref:hypothetical protein n=1 Tax=Nocardioides sp. TaxID=35761 RepID=UPI0039E3ED94